jgi:hypothetical protein
MEISEENYQKAIAVVWDTSSGSVSNLQRKLHWGYCRAAAAIDRMQKEFIVSPMSASGRRDVYPSDIHQLWKELQAAKAQSVPEGFVLVSKDRLAKAVDGIEALFEEYSLLALGELLPIQQDLNAMIEAQEQGHE